MNETLTTTLGYNTIIDSNLGTYSVNFDLTSLLSQKQKEELIIKLLESEDEFMPILKKYLVGYLDKVLENPEPLVKELIKEKDDKINELSKEVEDLKKEVETLKNNIPLIPSEPIPLGPNPYHSPWGDGGITWSGTLSSSYNAMNLVSSSTSTTTA